MLALIIIIGGDSPLMLCVSLTFLESDATFWVSYSKRDNDIFHSCFNYEILPEAAQEIIIE